MMREHYLLPGEVARLFRVTPRTVTRWAKEGRLPWVRTLGGHRRYPREEVMRLRERMEVQRALGTR